jgi:hypothetical protein
MIRRMRAPPLPVAVLVAALGCSSSVGDYPMAPACDFGDGGSCPPPVFTDGGTTTSSTSSGTGTGGGSGAQATLSGSLALVSSPTFSLQTASAYQGYATIVGSGPGGVATANYDLMTSSFTLTGLSTGSQWLLVTASDGSFDTNQTYSVVTVPSASPVTLPVVATPTLTQIAAGIPALSGGLSQTAAQIVVEVTKGGAPYANVSATGGTGSAVVVYDTGAGTYAASATATGSGGTILLFNAQLSGESVLTLKDNASAATISVALHAAAGSVTYAVSAN